MKHFRESSARRVAVAATAAMFTFAGLAAPAAAVVDVRTDRLQGTDRYGTAAAVATASFPSGATSVIVASGEQFPDALAGTALGGDRAAPILLTERDRLPAATSEAIDTLKATNVVVLGGTAAVSSAVQKQLDDKVTGNVTRIAGATRYDTAAAIARDVGSDGVGTTNGRKTAIIATGLNFADALAGGPIAAAGSGGDQLPVLLTNSTVPAATSEAITALGIKQVIILGGTSAVPQEVENQLEAQTGTDAVRIAGTTRYATATAVAEESLKSAYGFTGKEVLLANASRFPDALAAGVLGAIRKAPILLAEVDSLPAATRTFLESHASTIEKVSALGGTAAISASTLTAAEQAAESGAATRRNETLAVTPTASAAQVNGTTRDYSVANLGTNAVDIALLDCSKVTTDANGNTVFANTNGNNVADGTQRPPSSPATPGTVDTASTPSRISMVNGQPTPTNDDHADAVAPSNGAVTFQITGPSSSTAASSCVIPVVYVDANVDNGLNGSTANPTVPTEAFGTGGATTFAPASATGGQFSVNVTDANPALRTFSGCTITNGNPELTNPGACATYSYDGGDSFQLDPTLTAMSIDEFTSRLSPDDDVRGTYNPNGTSTFVLADEAPVAPTNVTATRSSSDPNSVTVSFTRSSTQGVDGYRVYRAEKLTATCPTLANGGSAYQLVSGGKSVTIPSDPVQPATFTDTTASAGKAYCYVVTAVDVLDESDGSAPASVTAVPVFTGATLASNAQSISLKYSEPISCSSVDPNGSDYAVTVGGTPSAPNLAGCASPGQTSDTVTLTYLQAVDKTKEIVVTAKAGGDGDTVKDPAGGAQPAGDAVKLTPPAFKSASAANNSPTLTVVYTEPIRCSTVDLGDFTLEVTAPAPGFVIDPATAPYTVSCVSPTGTGATATSDTIAFTFTNPSANKYVSGQTIKVTSKQSTTDQDTVLDTDGQPQQVGDTISTTVA